MTDLKIERTGGSYCAIIPTHGRPVFLQRAVKSVLDQTAPATEIIIVDDASEPPVTPQDFNAGAGVKITILRHERSLGGAQARNAGIAAAHCRFVAFLDDDDEWLPDKMAEQLQYLEQHPAVGLVSCGHFRVEAGSVYEESFTNAFVHRYQQFDNFFGSFSFLTVRLDVLESGVQLDPRLPALQDWDFALRCVARADFGIIEKPLVRYHAHEQPRITTGNRNRVRGLRMFYFNHRDRLDADARRWHLARVIFERARGLKGALRVRQIIKSVRAASMVRLPWRIKMRALAGRVAILFWDRHAVLKFRARALSALHQIRKPAPSPAAKISHDAQP